MQLIMTDKKKFSKFLVAFAFMLLVATVAVTSSLSFARAQVAHADASITYISSEADYLDFLDDCRLGVTRGKKYVLSTDIYLTRYYEEKGADSSKIVFEGELDGDGHAIVGYRATNAYFSVIAPGAVVKNLNFVGALVLSDGLDGLLVTDNLGTVQGVTVTGKISGSVVSGLVAYNFGAIRDTIVCVELDGTTTSPFALTNSSEAEPRLTDVIQYVVESYPDFSPVYEITGARCPSNGGYGTTISYSVADYSDLLWYLYAYASAAENDEVLPTATQLKYIDLYNEPLPTEVNGLLTQLVSENRDLSLNYNGYYNATAVMGGDVISAYSGCESGSTITVAQAISGSGTAQDPYLVGTAQELAYIASLEGTPFVKLTQDVDLVRVANDCYKPAGEAWITDFNGIFDGNGRTISGLFGYPLFGSVGGTVKNLTVIGKTDGAMLALSVDGVVDGVRAYGSADCAIGILSGGTVTRSDIKLNGAVVGSLEGGTLAKSRNYGENFVNSSIGGRITDCQNISVTDNSAFNATATDSVCVRAHDTVFTADTDRYSLVDAGSTGGFSLSTAGWSFGTELGWGYPKGATDNPTLVFAYDNAVYKKVGLFAGGNASGVYGAENDFPPIAVSPDNGVIRKTAIEEIIFEEVPYSIRNALLADYGEGKVFEWYYLDGKTHPNEYFDYASGDSELVLYRETDYYYVTGRLSITADNEGSLTFKCVRYGLDNVYVQDRLGFNNYRVTFSDVYGFTQTDVANPIGYDGVTVEVYKDGAPYNGRFITTKGTYVMRVTVAPTADCTGAVFQGSYTVTEGTIDLAEYELTSDIGGLSEATAVEYVSGSEFNPSFTLDGLRRKGVTYAYDIVAFVRHNGNVESADRISEAGIYTLSIVVNVVGYAPYVSETEFYVKRKAITVGALLGGSSVVFGSEHPSVDYISSEFGANTFAMLGGLTYTTNYTKFSSVGRYTVEVASIEDDFNPNYLFVKGLPSTFSVTPATIDHTNCEFTAKTVVYDGNPQSVSVNFGNLGLVEGDVATYDYTVVYGYNGNEQSTPFEFTNVGSYNGLYAKVTPNTQNYSSFTVTGAELVINPIPVKLTAKDVSVHYGAQPTYVVEITRADGLADIDEVYSEIITEGTDYTVTSAYEKGVTQAGSVLPIRITLKNENVGNYRITSVVEGSLTVGKKTYTLDVSTSYPYNGNPVVLDYNGENPMMANGYPKYYSVRGGVETPLEGAPINVNDATAVYRAYIKTAETEEYYSQEKTVDFSITRVDFTPRNLYIFNGTQKSELNGSIDLTYNGVPYVIDYDKATLPEGAYFVWNYTYEKLIDGVWTSISATNDPPKLDSVGSIRGVSVTASGNANYNDFTVGSTANGLRILPFTLTHVKPQNLVYKGEDGFTVEEISAIINALEYDGEHKPFDVDEVAFEVRYAQKIVIPGEYTVNVISSNTSYIATPVTIIVEKASVDVDLTDLTVFSYEYGTLYNALDSLPSLTYRAQISLDGVSTERELTLRVGCADYQTSYIAPGTYSIASIDSFVTDGVVCIDYNPVGGEGRVIVHPKTVRFNRYDLSLDGKGIKDEYVYGETFVLYARVPLAKVAGAVGSDDPEITITVDRTVKHAGSYHFTAVAERKIPGDDVDESGRPIDVACYTIPEELSAFTCVVNKKSVEYSVEPVTVYLGDEIPTVFVATYSGADAGVLEEYSIVGLTPGIAGAFSVELKLFNVVDGVRYEDYLPVKQDVNAKELTVALRSFGQETVAIDTERTYNGAPVYAEVRGVPDGASVSYDLTPTDVGEYSVKVTFTKNGYEDKTMIVKVCIGKATPYIEQDEVRVEFVTSHIMTSADISGVRASYNGNPVDGSFAFTETLPRQTLVYGEYAYKLDFIPKDLKNFKKVTVNYRITTYIVNGECSIDLGEVKDGVISGKGSVKIGATIKDEYKGAVILYVNGEAILNNEYEFLASEENVLIELKVLGETIYSEVIDVRVLTGGTVVKPDDSPSSGLTPTKPDTKFAIVDEGKARTIKIVGISVGCAVGVGIIVVVIVVVVKKKSQNGG